jgi:hypothetical protein
MAEGLLCFKDPPAIAMGVAAPLMDMVLKISTSVMKCTKATTKDSSVAPVHMTTAPDVSAGEVANCGWVFPLL